MRKILTTAVAAVALGAAAVGMSTSAEARWYGHYWGPGPFVAGAVAGAAVAAAATAPYYYRPYAYYGYYGPACRNVWNGDYWVRACY